MGHCALVPCHRFIICSVLLACCGLRVNVVALQAEDTATPPNESTLLTLHVSSPSLHVSSVKGKDEEENVPLRNETNLPTRSTEPSRRPKAAATQMSDLPRLSWVVVGGAFGAWMLAGVILQWIVKPNYSRAQEWFIYCLAMFTVIAVPAAFAVMHGRAAELRGAKNPYWKVGLGEATKLLMAMTILPMLRHLSFVRYVFRSSFERTTSFHIVIGVLALAAGTAHGVALVYNRPERSISTKGKHPVLYGTLSWGMMILLTITGLLRSRLYVTFRLVHWLYIAAFGLAIVHVNNFYVMLTPPLVLLGLDYMWRLGSTIRFGARITSAEFDASSSTTWLRLSLGSQAAFTPPPPGCYYCLTIPGVGSLFSHPFSVVTSRGGELLFAVQIAGRWTRALADAAPRLKGRRVLLMGPYGALSFPLDKTGILLIVVGGSGAAPAISLLEALVEGEGSSARLRYPSLRAVHVLWASRHPSLLVKGAALIEELLERCVRAGLCAVSASLHCTTPSSLLPLRNESGDVKCSYPDASPPPPLFGLGRYGAINAQGSASALHSGNARAVRCTWHNGRPDITNFLLRKHSSAPTPRPIPTASTAEVPVEGSAFVSSVNVFASGPDALLSQVKTSVSEANRELEISRRYDSGVEGKVQTNAESSLRAHFEIFII